MTTMTARVKSGSLCRYARARAVLRDAVDDIAIAIWTRDHVRRPVLDA
jgi:hypothetical protein